MDLLTDALLNWLAVGAIELLLLAYVWVGVNRQGKFTPNPRLSHMSGFVPSYWLSPVSSDRKEWFHCE